MRRRLCLLTAMALMAVAAVEGFWQLDAILGSAIEGETAEAEETSVVVRLAEVRARRALRRLSEARTPWLSAGRFAGARSKEDVAIPHVRLSRDRIRPSGRVLLHRDRRLLI